MNIPVVILPDGETPIRVEGTVADVEHWREAATEGVATLTDQTAESKVGMIWFVRETAALLTKALTTGEGIVWIDVNDKCDRMSLPVNDD